MDPHVQRLEDALGRQEMPERPDLDKINRFSTELVDHIIAKATAEGFDCAHAFASLLQVTAWLAATACLPNKQHPKTLIYAQNQSAVLAAMILQSLGIAAEVQASPVVDGACQCPTCVERRRAAN